jgi:putative Mg2+ transporter-C (MgtC) family protein
MLPTYTIFWRLGVAALCGVAIGVERDVHRRPAGMRTSLFVCMGAALFTILSGEVAHIFGDVGSTRIASNLVQGIGFLGAGAILRERGSVVGLTTAATIFVEAALGMAIGVGLYAVGLFTVGIILFSLVVLGWAADRFNIKQLMTGFRITTEHAQETTEKLQKVLQELHVSFQHYQVAMAGGKSIVEFDAEVSHRQRQQIVMRLSQPGVVAEMVPLEGHHE